ncbi:MAG: hypothetical protein ACK56I_08860, partial [bacterium]
GDPALELCAVRYAHDLRQRQSGRTPPADHDRRGAEFGLFRPAGGQFRPADQGIESRRVETHAGQGRRSDFCYGRSRALRDARQPGQVVDDAGPFRWFAGHGSRGDSAQQRSSGITVLYPDGAAQN